ncbi:VWA domain-containing protein, partial [uncultured Pseudoalteromonas sp.]|uniref:VWA domain-containing protein n=1 Tax=uncultured Pseudoalteromonas sp. TaxID=114053 RepID=UPI0025990931
SSDDNQTGDSSDDNQTGDSSDDNQTDNSKSSDEKDKSGYSLNACSDDIQSALDADEDELICDLHKKIRELMEEKAEEFEQKFVEEFDAPYFAPALPFTCKKSANASGIPDWVTEARMNSQRIKTVLHSILYDRNKSKRSFDKQGTDLCSGAIWGVKAGNSRIFRTDAITRAPNSAFTILVDKSGSMGSSDMRTANVAAYSIAQALEFLKGTECEVLYYPFGSHDEPHNHVAKAFNERMASVTSTSFNVHANGGTPTAEALLGAVTNLIQRKEERKIIFLITDGDTAGPNVKAALQECDVLGITVIGIGIKTGELSGFENRPTMLIDQCADLAPAMFNFLRDYYQA